MLHINPQGLEILTLIRKREITYHYHYNFMVKILLYIFFYFS
jgi:hypothetical protein